MKRTFGIWIFFFFLLFGFSTVIAVEKIYRPRMITFEVVSDNRGVLPLRSVHEDHYFSRSGPCYVEALRGERYSIRFRNDSSRWIGVVIAVDGRNVISGNKTSLGPNESMYVLQPYSEGICDGWRAGRSNVNRFYFTEAQDSYAGSWGDYSAMGTIGVAVFPESHWHARDRISMQYNRSSGRGPDSFAEKSRREGALERVPGSSEQKRGDASCMPMYRSPPGTGYGENSYSPVTEVDFTPASEPSEKIVINYRWESPHLYREPQIEFPRNDSRFVPPPPK